MACRCPLSVFKSGGSRPAIAASKIRPASSALGQSMAEVGCLHWPETWRGRGLGQQAANAGECVLAAFQGSVWRFGGRLGRQADARQKLGRCLQQELGTAGQSSAWLVRNVAWLWPRGGWDRLHDRIPSRGEASYLGLRTCNDQCSYSKLRNLQIIFMIWWELQV